MLGVHLPFRLMLIMRVLLQENRVATLQSLSGTGSLRVAAEFIAKFLPGKTAYLSNPTWGNHKVQAAYQPQAPSATSLCPHALVCMHQLMIQICWAYAH